MSGDSGTDTITTPAEFKTALGELLAVARQNGVSPRGSWVYRSDELRTNWEAEIYELR